ncbi:hypothetical protein RRU94_18935 [Domibacillus sp. DTU_2020_1001157_1_SI_ALB_TIR_016]|uniref:hypothetical protein n=1 Tax=Domibacillus sp. DTU_2020_1001157_1_SI_ALB_TIR_016 TaxID=3077789 RepID=UPI0028E6DB4E|nr:hypothetical protein [Domibacillus sp. DTU_2020_1001157_1_SI_ALB_TIR_016]WNS79599.1 hypothetical protein RRU94_18935 [Domibacillus sp. DTU_2020_1001157_1_SI_ALB_TIR_016]
MSQKEKVFQIISRELLNMIEIGKFSSGSKLPTEMELTSHFSVRRAETIHTVKARQIKNPLGSD